MENIGASKHLVIGLGEIGKALLTVLSEKYYVKGIDVGMSVDEKFDVIHVCFPYSTKFKEYVEGYRVEYLVEGGLIVIHSTLPVGQTAEIKDAVHSPVRGIHPNLVEGIKTFVKVFGGARAEEAAGYFSELGVEVATSQDPRNTEAFKLWDTTTYGWNIILEKEIYEYCKIHHLDFGFVYTLSNNSYNDGYEKLGHPEYKKYVLRHVEGGIGGHCVVPNCGLLGGSVAGIISGVDAKLHRTEPVVVAVSGYFDPLHSGHLDLFRDARQLGDKLVVILNSDVQATLKKGKSFMKESERVEIIKSLRWVDSVVLSVDNDSSVCKTLEMLSPDVFANGGDRKCEGDIAESEICNRLGIKMVFGVGGIAKKQSSSWLLSNYQNTNS